MPRFVAILVLFALPAPARLDAQPPVPGLNVPPGFGVTEYADGKLANDIYCMTVDAHGRIVVAGRGYIRILVDDDGDGRADRAIAFPGAPKDGAMGLCWETDALFVVGDGGLRRFPVKDGKAAGPSALIRAMKTGGEHAAHAVRRGPDGWLYVLCGNHTGVDRSFAQLPASPVKEPIAGCVVRFTPDLAKSEIVAHGFRNAYGMDFDAAGDLFTYDSDNERCVSLPWYEPTRLYRVVAGGFYGWLSPQRASFWRMPPYFFDVIAPVATLGRGSPTGVACYRHAQFPKQYRGGLFLCDWTFGKIHYADPHGPAPCRPSVFLSSSGENGFAPTAAVVHPETGDLYVATGGRGTRGAVYRIRYPQGLAEARRTGVSKVQPRSQVPTAIRAPDPRSLDTVLTGDRAALKEASKWLDQKSAADRLKGVRLLQRYLGDIGVAKEIGTIWEGYSARMQATSMAFAPELVALFPTDDRDLDREMTRTLAMLRVDDPTLREKILAKLGPESDPVEDIHYLAVFAQLPGRRSPKATTRIAAALIEIDRKIAARKLNRDSNWPLRVRELYGRLARQDANLHEAVVGHPQFGRPDHALFAQVAGFPRARAAAVFLDRVQHDKDYVLTAAVVDVLGALPPATTAPVLRTLWGQAGQDAAILTLLARVPVAADRSKFVDGLGSAQPETVRACLGALGALAFPDDGGETLGLLLALKRLPESQKPLRADVLARLQSLTGQRWPAGDPAWLGWFAQAHPKLAPRLTNPDGVDVAAWQKRQTALDWSTGNADRGAKVFHKASCASCHSAGQSIGPDLAGVAGRFSRVDLFTAIVQPSRDVPARYQVTVVETDDGKVYQGIVIYDAVDSLLLQTGPAAMVRLDGHAISHRRVSPTSLMPAGLLDALTDGEVVDLYAYLRSLGADNPQTGGEGRE